MREGCQIYKIFVCLSLLIALTGSLVGCGGTSDPSPPPPGGKIPIVSHVFVLVEENHAFEQVIGTPSMPYTNGLAQKYALATRFYANRHNSLPNYFMLTVGNLITTNDLFTGTVTANNVARALTKAGKSWKAYADSLPHIGYLGPSVGAYGKDHVPFTYFSDVLNSSSQAANVVPFSQFASDIQNGTLPDYAMIIPDFVNDGHDCPQPNCTDTQKLSHIDNWIQSNIAPLINSSAFGNSVLIYTWDESNPNDFTNQGGHIATILVSTTVRGGFQSTTMYQHPSTLKLSMQLLGVTDFPGLAASAPDMTEFFK